MSDLAILKGGHCRASLLRVTTLHRLPERDKIIAVALEIYRAVSSVFRQLQIAYSGFLSAGLGLHDKQRVGLYSEGLHFMADSHEILVLSVLAFLLKRSYVIYYYTADLDFLYLLEFLYVFLDFPE